VCRDETKVVLQLGSFGSRPDIQIFSAAGIPLGRVLWDGGRILAAGWSDVEELLVVDDRGKVQRFTCLGQPSRPSSSSSSAAGRAGATEATQFSLGAAVESEGVADVVISDQSIVARTAAGHLWCIPDVTQPRSTRYPDPTPSLGGGGGGNTRGSAAVHCMCPIPPNLSSSDLLEVLVAVDTTVITVDSDEISTSAVYEGPIVKLALSPDGRAVAGYAADDVIYIWTANLEETLARVFLNDTVEDMSDSLGIDNAAEVLPSGLPDNFIWCGSDGVIASWNGVGALLVTVQGAYRWWDLGPGAVSLINEVDGVRALTSDQHVFIRSVPAPLASVLEIGSTSPGALLHDARKLYDERDARAAAELLDVLRGGDLPVAAAACLGAAAAEMDPVKQESLMRAGCYGRAFLALNTDDSGTSNNTLDSSVNAAAGGKEVVILARTLRVFNALREPEIALPLTMPQYEALGLPRLIIRLTARRHYLLALRVCAALEASPENVLFRWACDKIAASASSAPDEELLHVLRSKLDGQEGVKWAAVAAHAQAQGRPRLAAALAEHESCAEDQIPLLLALGEEEGALRKAVDSGDSDLIFEVLLSLWRQLKRQHHSQQQQQRFFDLMARYPSAAALMSKFLVGTSDPDAPLALWEAIQDFRAIAVMHIESALNPSTPTPQKLKEWTHAKDAYARDERAGHEDAKFEGAAIAVALRLAEVQTELEKTSGREGFKDLSVVDTIKQCLRLGLRDQAQKLAKEFKVPEKQQMLLSIEASAVAQDWPALQHMASKLDRRAPVTIEHIISAVRAHNAPVPTIRWFIDRISGDSGLLRRAQLYSEVGLVREANMLAEQAEMAGASAGVLGSLRDAVGGTVGSFLGGSSSSGGR
jgi:vacuolar protein sorting-associated protein 16